MITWTDSYNFQSWGPFVCTLSAALLMCSPPTWVRNILISEVSILRKIWRYIWLVFFLNDVSALTQGSVDIGIACLYHAYFPGLRLGVWSSCPLSRFIQWAHQSEGTAIFIFGNVKLIPISTDPHCVSKEANKVFTFLFEVVTLAAIEEVPETI